MDRDTQKAIETFIAGGVVIFPTDTAFGIGCRMDNSSSVRKVFSLRNRPEEKAVLVLVDSIDMVKKYAQTIPDDVHELMKKFWPGGLTIVLPCNISKVPLLTRGGGKTLGFRMPDHPQIRQIIHAVGVPIIAPSANVSGGKTPFVFSDVDPVLVRAVDFALHGTCTLGTPSTVIDCSVKPWKILREGAVNINSSRI